MNKFFMITGLPGSGKSTKAQDLSKMYNAVIHSSDKIREELFGTADVQDGNDLVFQTLHKRVKSDLRDGKNVIYDACNINYKRRMAFLREIQKINCEKIAILMATPYKDCLENNLKRERKVPEEAIVRMYKNFYIPQYYEGWHDIQIIGRKTGHTITTTLNRLKNIEQHNSHHTLTIGNHCRKCCEIIEQNYDNINLSYAALLHDIGKEFTQEFKNSKGEATAEAHYYQHHLVSAYDALFLLDSIELPNFDLLETIALITWHMQPFNGINNKFIKMVGQDFVDKLMLLHEADKLAK